MPPRRRDATLAAPLAALIRAVPPSPSPDRLFHLRIVFFGSSDFAIPSLKALKAAGQSPMLVVTKPDAPRGRGRKIYDSDVKLGAQELGLPCSQPVDPHSPEFLAQLKAMKPSTR